MVVVPITIASGTTDRTPSRSSTVCGSCRAEIPYLPLPGGDLSVRAFRYQDSTSRSLSFSS